MNTTKLLRLIFLCLCGTLFCLAACEDNALPANSNGTDGEAADLRFRVADRPDTRISYNGQSSTFDNGEAIGCIIATQQLDGKYTYTANSKWHYTDGYLVLDSELPDLISNLNDTEDGYLTFDESATDTYAFYFYYPYVDNASIRQNIINAIDNCDETNNPFYQILEWPNSGTNKGLTFGNNQTFNPPGDDNNNTYLIIAYGKQYILTGEAVSQGNINDWSQFNTYTWTAYPCFTNHTQRGKAQANNSDFLWVAVEGVSQAEHRTYNLWFNKKTATVAVDAAEGISNIYFTPQADNALMRGKEINLQTGELTDYEYSDNIYTGSIQQQYMYFSPSETLTPYHNTGGDGYHRITFVPQSSFRCNLHFTLNGTAHTIDLSTEIPSLQEGYLYIIHINPAGQTTLEIVDWEQEHFEILNPTTE